MSLFSAISISLKTSSFSLLPSTAATFRVSICSISSFLYLFLCFAFSSCFLFSASSSCSVRILLSTIFSCSNFKSLVFCSSFSLICCCKNSTFSLRFCFASSLFATSSSNARCASALTTSRDAFSASSRSLRFLSFSVFALSLILTRSSRIFCFFFASASNCSWSLTTAFAAASSAICRSFAFCSASNFLTSIFFFLSSCHSFACFMSSAFCISFFLKAASFSSSRAARAFSFSYFA
mmetsp:Transcript_5710/g.10244  ORF Transcript_5710/g.10244 Transcript_5710/m.10244 type:complete len:237 (+) Transcript_5710:126-836(+)